MDDRELYVTAKKLFAQRRVAEAFAIYEQLARAGDSHCQVFVGWMYHQGVGITKDDVKAEEWFARAATLGSKEGQFYCGRFALLSGDYERAREWFHKAATKEYGPALLWLGLIFVRGLGVTADTDRGVAYLERAAHAGNFLALRELGLLTVRGRLGIWKIPLGLVMVLYAVIGGIVTALINRDPEKVTG
jgi:uncharacterized protein